MSQLLDTLKELNVTILDSAQGYPPTNKWNTETLLGQAQAASKGFTIDSKTHSSIVGPLNKENVASGLDKTLKLLGTNKVSKHIVIRRS